MSKPLEPTEEQEVRIIMALDSMGVPAGCAPSDAGRIWDSIRDMVLEAAAAECDRHLYACDAARAIRAMRGDR